MKTTSEAPRWISRLPISRQLAPAPYARLHPLLDGSGLHYSLCDRQIAWNLQNNDSISGFLMDFSTGKTYAVFSQMYESTARRISFTRSSIRFRLLQGFNRVF
jgi:hypothetical protein